MRLTKILPFMSVGLATVTLPEHFSIIADADRFVLV